MVIADSDGNRGTALVKTVSIADAEKTQLGNGEQAVDQAREQRGFVLMRYAISGEQSAAAIGCGGIVTAAELGEVVDRSADSGNQLLHLRAGFPAIGKRIGGRAHFVGPELQQPLALSIQRAHVRAEEFVGRADEEIAIERTDVDGSVRRVMNG